MRLMASVLISKSDSQTRNAGTKKAPFLGLCGVPGATRTPGLSLRRRSLYPTELREHGLWEVALGECTSSTLGGLCCTYNNIHHGNIINILRYFYFETQDVVVSSVTCIDYTTEQNRSTPYRVPKMVPYRTRFFRHNSRKTAFIILKK